MPLSEVKVESALGSITKRRHRRATADGCPQVDHRSDLSDGDSGECQSTAMVVSGKGIGEIAKAVALLLPGPDTPGFNLCSPRSLQVWLALVHHAAHHGQWCRPDNLPPGRYEELRSLRPSGLTAKWTIEQLADACGVDARTVHRLMAELRDLGWLRWSRVRDNDGQFAGFLFVMQVPPCTLTATATHRYREDLAKKRNKLIEAESRIRNWRPDLFSEATDEKP